METQAKTLAKSPRFQEAKAQLLQAIREASANVRQVRPPSSSSDARERYQQALKDFSKDRGRDLYYPFLGSGLGAGPYVELADGSVKLDMITGIGINFFGHTHPELIGEMIEGLGADVMQGNLEPGVEAKDLLHTLLSRVGEGSRLKHGWLTSCGTMANEIALKITRQKKSPATMILAFNDCFAGRSTAMQEVTDNAAYRQGQPNYGFVRYLPFYNSKVGLEKSTQDTLDAMKAHLSRNPGQFCAIMTELVQGEGGFNFAPREFYVRVFEEAKKSGLAVWCDEVQTFGRTGELFAYQAFGLNELVDVVTIGKMLQACAVLYTEEFNPKPGLVAGTFSGSTVALRTGKTVVEVLSRDGFLGKTGKINQLSERFLTNLRRMSETTCKGLIGESRAIGGMIAFEPHKGTMDDCKKLLMKLFDLGVVAFYCGHGPYLIRMLPPLAAMNEQDVDTVCKLIEQGLQETRG